jgi:very-short-patch-repair endonuclease
MLQVGHGRSAPNPVQPASACQAERHQQGTLAERRDSRRETLPNLPRKAGVPYRFQQGFYTPYHRIVDFYLPEQNLVIEIDGPCHDPEKDRRRDEWFTRERGIKIIRISNEEAMSGKFTVRDFVR